MALLQLSAHEGEERREADEGCLDRSAHAEEREDRGETPDAEAAYILERIIEASTREGDLILDPFCGSSTKGFAARKLKRAYIGIDKEREYIELSVRRLRKETQ